VARTHLVDLVGDRLRKELARSDAGEPSAPMSPGSGPGYIGGVNTGSPPSAFSMLHARQRWTISSITTDLMRSLAAPLPPGRIE